MTIFGRIQLSILSLFVVLGMAACTSASQQTYSLDGDSTLTFKGYKKSGAFESGGFKRFTAQMTLVDENPEGGHLEVTIDTASIETPKGMLTGHLKNTDFFDVAKFPTVKFVSTRITKGDFAYTVEGNLTMLGVTKPYALVADIAVQGDIVTFSADFTLQQFDFGMTYTGQSGNPIRNGVDVHVEAKAKRVRVEPETAPAG